MLCSLPRASGVAKGTRKGKVSGSRPFFLTAFTDAVSHFTVRVDTAMEVVFPPVPFYLNVSVLADDEKGRVRFACSALVQVSRVGGQKHNGAEAAVTLTNKMYHPSDDNAVAAEFVLTGVEGQALTPPKLTHLCVHSLQGTAFAYDGWYAKEDVRAGVPFLGAEGWLDTTKLRKMFTVACKRAKMILEGEFTAEDCVAVTLQGAAGNYTGQHGGDWRGPGYAACATNQDCDGMAMNVLVFFVAIKRECTAWHPVDEMERTVLKCLANYTTPLFITGRSAQPSSLLPDPDTVARADAAASALSDRKAAADAYRSVMADATWTKAGGPDKWTIGHAWAGIASPGGHFIHIEATTPGAATATCGVPEFEYRERIVKAGGAGDCNGSHGPVKTVGVRRHHKAAYMPCAAYTPTAMYTTSGLRDVCVDKAAETSVTSGASIYYGTTLQAVARPAPRSQLYALGAHKPRTAFIPAFTKPAGLGPYVVECNPHASSGINGFSRFSAVSLPL